MKKNHLLLITATALLLGACNNDDILTGQPEEKGSAPQVVATVEQIPDTRAGVVEDADYTKGEQFYWSNKDATTVFFRNSSMTNAIEYKRTDYEANVAQGVQSKNCTFDVIQSENIDNGQYTAYGFFPTSAWKLDPYFLDYLTVNTPALQTQNQPNSTHLGQYMLMKAQNDVTIDGENSINLSYKHLASVLRFAVWNNSGDNNLKLTNINVKLSSGKAVFATNAKLDDADAVSLTVTNSSKVLGLTLQLTGDARNFSTKDGKSQCEGYMAVLPTDADAFINSDNVIIELSLTDGTNNYLVTKTYHIGTDLGFLSNGIEQGKSYYFRLKVDADDLLNPLSGTSYAVGDYWPDATAPEGIVFWVKPGRFGTQGKVVGLNETYISKWGPDKDEATAGVTGIQSLTDGATATRSMIAEYKSIGTFAADYPAFYHIYNTVNGGNENGVWYLPARDELKMLFAGYSSKVYESITDWTTNNMPDYNSVDCIAARTEFNTKLTAKSGMAINGSGNEVSQWYLSSSEISEDQFYSLNLEEGKYSSDPKSIDGNIRWIREF